MHLCVSTLDWGSVWLVWLGVHAMRRYMMGDDYMAAPVLNLGQRARMVYFPLGADWTHHYTVRHTEYENLDQLVTSQHFGEVLALICSIRRFAGQSVQRR